MKKLLLLLLLSLGFVGLVNADINDNAYIDDDLLLKIKNAGLIYTKKCGPDPNMNTWNECIGRFVDRGGNFYFGDINFGVPNGYGRLDLVNLGNFYVGEFKNGYSEGQGFMRSYDGYHRMEGEWKDARLHGQGSEFHSIEEDFKYAYRGGYKDGKFHGQGQFFKQDKLVEGIFKEGKFQYPNNGYKSGNSWECNSGYTKYEMSCLKIPPNTYVSGDRFKCLSGYTRNRKDIIEGCVKLPANAYAFGVGWLCNSGYTKSGYRCKKKPENNLIADLFNSISSGNSNSSSYNSSSSSYNSSSSSYNNSTPSYNSNSSSGYTTTFGNTYQYNLNNPVDRVKYKSDPGAKIRDSIGNQYIRELEYITKQSGGGILNNNSGVVKWNNISPIQPFSGFGSF